VGKLKTEIGTTENTFFATDGHGFDTDFYQRSFMDRMAGCGVGARLSGSFALPVSLRVYGGQRRREANILPAFFGAIRVNPGKSGYYFFHSGELRSIPVHSGVK
jgi:hypothetical protein